MKAGEKSLIVFNTLYYTDNKIRFFYIILFITKQISFKCSQVTNVQKTIRLSTFLILFKIFLAFKSCGNKYFPRKSISISEMGCILDLKT